MIVHLQMHTHILYIYIYIFYSPSTKSVPMNVEWGHAIDAKYWKAIYLYSCGLYALASTAYPIFSYALVREYRLTGNQWSQLSFTNEDYEFALVTTVYKYDIAIQVHRVWVTSQVNCGDITLMGYSRPFLLTTAKWVIDDYFPQVCVFKVWNSKYEII